MKEIEVDTKPKRIVMPVAAPVEEQLPGGLDLVRRIYERALRGIDGQMKARNDTIDPDTVKAVRDIAGTLIDIERAEREREKHDKFAGKLANLTEAELWAIVNKQ